MAIKGALEATLSVNAALPTGADDAARLTSAQGARANYTDCGEVISIGEFGREYQTVRTNNLASGATRKFKGSYDNGSFQADLLFDSADPGQTILEAAGKSTAKYAFRVAFPGDSGSNSEEFFFQALVTSLKRIVGGPDDAIMLRCQVEIDHETILEGTYTVS